MAVISLKLSFTPPPRIHRHLYGGHTPVLAVIMPFVFTFANSSPNQSLVFREGREDAEDDGDAGVELDAHKAVGDGVRDVLKVHGFAFDQDADGDHCIEWLREHCRGYRGGIGSGCCSTRRKGRRTKVESGEKVCHVCPRSARLDSRACYHPTRRKVQTSSGFGSQRCNVLGNSHREFITAWDALNHDIALLDSNGLEFGDCALEEGINYGLVPSGMDDRDAEGRAVEGRFGKGDSLDRRIGHGCSSGENLRAKNRRTSGEERKAQESGNRGM